MFGAKLALDSYLSSHKRRRLHYFTKLKSEARASWLVACNSIFHECSAHKNSLIFSECIGKSFMSKFFTFFITVLTTNLVGITFLFLVRTATAEVLCQNLLISNSQVSPYADQKLLQADLLLRTVTALRTLNDIELLPAELVKSYSQFFGIKPEQLLDERILDWMENQGLWRKTNPHRTAHHELKLPDLKNNNSREDIIDGIRGYGWFIFPKSYPIFKKPETQALLSKFSTSTLGLGYAEENNHVQAFRFKMEFLNRISNILQLEYNRFSEKGIELLYNKLDLVHFFQTGSDANNFFYEIANTTWHQRAKAKGFKLDESQTGEILVFDGAFGAGRGRLEGLGLINPDPARAKWRITSPHTKTMKIEDPQHLREIEILEARTLREIEEKANDPKMRVGGILFEPILGSKGVYVYRPEFVTKLRNLCDHLGIPILADEILTGGGRTGRFFGYQHYPDFVPDFISVGKGLQVAGLLAVNRNRFDGPKYPTYSGNTNNKQAVGSTLNVHPEAIIKSIAVLKEIGEKGLIENAEVKGQALLSALQSEQLKDSRIKEVRGIGLLIYIDSGDKNYIGLQTAQNRFMPYYTLSDKDIDQIIEAIR